MEEKTREIQANMLNYDMDELTEAGELESGTDSKPIRMILRPIILCIVDDCFDKLSIIEKSYSNYVSGIYDIPFEYVSATIRFDFSEEKLYKESRLNGEINDFTNLSAIVNFTMKILQRSAQDLYRIGSCQLFNEMLLWQDNMKQDEIDVVQNNEQLKAQHSWLLQEIASERTELMRKIREVEQQIQKSNGSFEETADKYSLEYLTVSCWEGSRQQQNKHASVDKEIAIRETIDRKKECCIDELQISKSLCNFFKEETKDLKNLINFWTDKYDEDINQKDINITSLKMKLDQTNDQIKALANEISKRKKEIIKCKRLARARQKLEGNLKEYAVKTIQRFWRKCRDEKNK